MAILFDFFFKSQYNSLLKITRQARIYPTKRQRRLIDEMLECHRELYNAVLADSEKHFEETKKSKGQFTLVKEYVSHFRKDERFAICNYSSLQQTVRRFAKARSAMIGKRSSKQRCKLRFKKFGRFNSIEYTYGDGLSIRNESVRIQHLGEIKTVWNAKPTKPSRAILTRKGDSYFVSFCESFVSDAVISTGDKSVGIDFGVKTLATLSNGETIESPKFAKKAKSESSKIHRRIHRAPKGSKLRAKHKQTLAKVHRKTANRRKDFNHKATRKLADEYDIVCAEDLAVSGIGSDFAPINFAISDLGIAQFKGFLTYKAENAGKRVVWVNPAYTTQTCSSCGTLVPKTLKERVHVCGCGHVEDRDINAAKNILTAGLRSLAQA